MATGAQDPSVPREASLGQALAPVLLLIGLLGTSVYLFGDGSSSGPNQIALILCTGVAAVVGLANGHRWTEIESGISRDAASTAGELVDLVPAPDLATHQSLHHHSNPEFQQTRHANPV